MAIEDFEQLDQGQRRLGLAVLVAGKGIDASMNRTINVPQGLKPKLILIHLRHD
jgi:hypothetical protein